MKFIDKSLIFIGLLGLTACGNKGISSVTTSIFIPPTIDDCNTTEQIEKFKKDGYLPLFYDSNFKKPFRLGKLGFKPGESPYHEEKLSLYDNEKEDYEWGLAQWGSNYDLCGKSTYSHEKSNYGLTHKITSIGKNGIAAKELIFNSLTGAINMKINGEIEYEHTRQDGEDWPCLLLEEGFEISDKTKANKCSAITIDIEYTVNKCESFIPKSEYNVNRHAGQFLMYVTLQNRNQNSEEYGRYIWFGLGLFDSRWEGKENPEYIAGDAGTGALIYSVSSSEYQIETKGKTPVIGQHAHAQMNVLEYARGALKEGIKRGYFETTTYDDLYVSGFNFGYEIPGTYNMDVDIDCVNVFSKAI